MGLYIGCSSSTTTEAGHIFQLCAYHIEGQSFGHFNSMSQSDSDSTLSAFEAIKKKKKKTSSFGLKTLYVSL